MAHSMGCDLVLASLDHLESWASEASEASAPPLATVSFCRSVDGGTERRSDLGTAPHVLCWRGHV